MTSGEHPSAMTSEDLGRPTLREWNLGDPVSGLAADEIGVWLVELDAGLESQAEIDAAEPGPELALLDADEQARAARFVRARDRRRFARCRAALREILGGLLGEPPPRSGFGRWLAASPSSILAAGWTAGRRFGSIVLIRPIWR